MVNKNTNNICITLSDNLLKIVQIKGVGPQSNIINVVSTDITSVEESDLPKLIQTELNTLNVKKANYYCVVPSNIVTTKNIEVPSINEEEIKSIVNLQASRHTPFSREEIQIGYVNLGVYKTNYTKVLLVIANKKTIEYQISLFERAGAKIEKVFYAPEGIASFYSNVLDLKSKENPSAIIDVGINSTDFLIVFKGNVISSRNIPSGRAQLAMEGKSAFQNLAEEISKTVELYQNEDIEKNPDIYILSTDDDITTQLKEALNSKMEEDVNVSSYLDNIKVKPNVLNKIAESDNHSFLDIIAPVLSFKDSKINLIPDEMILQRAIANQGKEIFKCSVLGLVVLALVALSLGLRISFHNSYLNKLKDKFKDNREKVEYLENKSIQTRIIQDYLKSRMISLDVINELYRNIPSEIYLTNVVMDEDGNVNIQGISDVASLVFNLGSSLKESTLFKSVEIKSTTAKKDRGKDVSAFEISLKLTTAKESENTNNNQAEE